MSFKTRSEQAIGSLKTASGLVMLINSLLLLMTFLIVITWRIKVIWFGVSPSSYSDIDNLSLYFLIALAVPLAGAILIYLKEVSTFEIPIQHGLAAIFMMIMCFVFGVLMIVSATFLLLKIPDDKKCDDSRACPQIMCGTIMSYICGAGLLGQSFLHLTEKNVVMTYM